MKLNLKNLSPLHTISLIVFALFLIGFPLVFTNQTTDIFSVPKQTLLAIASLLGILLLGAKAISESTVRIRRTFLDVPILLFTLFVVLSAFFSQNRIDSVISIFPFLFSVLLFFAVVNHIRTKNDILFSVLSFLLAGSIVSIIITLSYFKIYILPISYTKTQFFSPFGSTLDQAIFLVISSVLGIFFIWPIISAKDQLKKIAKNLQALFIIATTIITVIGTGFTLYQLAVPQKAVILPFATGFQTAFAAISQDSGRLLPGFLFGSGFGTFATVFTKFKLPQFNLISSVWSLTFYRSSSFVLELLATTGVLGLLGFLWVVIRSLKAIDLKSLVKGKTVSQNPFCLPLLLLILASFTLPFSPTIVALLFVVLGLFVAAQGTSIEPGIFDIEMYLVAFKKGMLAIESAKNKTGERGKLLPIIFTIVLTVVTGALGYYTYLYVNSDVLFQKSVEAAGKNLGSQTYDFQNNAIIIFPYRDGYFRVFSQTNLAIAAFIANQQKDNKNSQAQDTIYRLIQQAINSAKQATNLSPKTAQNWENLSSIYRALIGFGQNADNFAVLAQQQAQALDPNNPQQYIVLGGVYYQLGKWEEAQRQFQVAISLKPDLPNGYYNLGHALESKGDLEQAIAQYKTVKMLVASDKTNSAKIDTEILALEQKIQTGKAQEQAAKEAARKEAEKPTDKLGISKPSTTLPVKKPPVSLPAPTSTKSATKI